MPDSSRCVPVTVMLLIVPSDAGSDAGATTGAGAAASCAIAGNAERPAIIVVANKAATTGRCLLLLFIAVTRITSKTRKILFPPQQTSPNRASLPDARQPIKPDRLFHSPKDDKSLKVTSTITVINSARPDL